MYSRLAVDGLNPEAAFFLPEDLVLVTAPASRKSGLGHYPRPLRASAFPRLEWSDGEKYGGLTPPLGECLDGFLRLAEASPERILQYARIWGPIGICRHGRPCTHDQRCEPLGGRYGATASGYRWEPIERWRYYATLAQAVLSSTARLCNGQEVTQQDLEGMLAWYAADSADADEWRESLIVAHEQRRFVGVVMSELFREAGLAPGVWWWDRRALPEVRLRFGHRASPPLFGALVIQLAAALTSAQGVYRCSWCQLPYTPAKRRPRRDRAAYCPRCSGEASLAAKRRWWHRNRSPAARE